MARTPYKWFNINRIGPGKRVNGKSGKAETGHITRGSAGQLALTVLEGIMEGLRHQGRPRRQWIHDIEEWTGCEHIQLKEMSQDRAQWRRKISEWSSAVAKPHRGRSTSEWVSEVLVMSQGDFIVELIRIYFHCHLEVTVAQQCHFSINGL